MTDIELVIKALTADAQKAIGGLTEGIKGLGESGGLLGGLGGVLGDVGRVAGGLALSGIQALGSGLVDLIQDAADAEKVQAALNAVLTSTKGAAGITADAANELAASLQRVTPFEADVVLGAQNMLLTFTNIHKEVFPRATETVLNLATAMGGDTKGAAIQLGKALNDPIAGVSALSRVGVTFTEQQKEQIKTLQESGDMIGAQTIVLNELQTEFGGAARAAGGTFAGQMAIAQHAMDDLVGAIGDALLPIITPLIGKFGELAQSAIPLVEGAVAAIIPMIAGIGPVFDTVIGAVGNFVRMFQLGADESSGTASNLMGIFKSAWDAITVIWYQAKTDIGIIIDALMTIWQTEFNSALAFFDENGADIQATFSEAWTQIQTIIGTAVTIVQTILTALAGFISAHGTEITGMFKGAWEVIKGLIDGTLTLISGLLTAALQLMNGDTSGALETLKGTFTRVWDDIKGIVKGAWDFISNIVTMATDAIGRLTGARSTASANGDYGGNYGSQAVRSASYSLGGDTYNLTGDMNAAKQIQSARQQTARAATLRAAWG